MFFGQCLRKLDFQCDVMALWQATGARNSLHWLQLVEPPTALAVGAFRKWYAERCGGIRALFRHLDVTRRGQVSLAERDLLIVVEHNKWYEYRYIDRYIDI